MGRDHADVAARATGARHTPHASDSRLRDLQAQIAAGTYAPDPADVAESLVGWIAEPRQFDRNDQESHRSDRC